jgi:ClpP class serine protease
MNYDIFSDLPHIATKLLHEPWLILPAHHLSMVEQLEAHRAQPADFRQALAAEKNKGGKKAAVEEPPEGQLNPVTFFDKNTGLAVIAVEGTIGKKLSWLETMCGGVDLNALEDGLSRLADEKPTAVQLYLDTPGGTVTGVAEAAAMIEEFAANVAPVHAYVDIMCCSAGEWLASGATSRCAAGSALLGSIGVYNAMFDQSARYAQQGVTVHLKTSGPLKGAGFPGTRPTDRQLEAMQAEVDRLAQDFYGQMNRRQKAAGRPALRR